MGSLPDLDQGPEVFETSDVESVDNLYAKPESTGPEVEVSQLDPKFAHKAFEETTLEGVLDLVDFSGSLSAEASGRNSYQSKKWTETKKQRLLRIAKELEEIQGEDEDEQSEVLRLQELLQASVEKRGKNGHYFDKLGEVYRQAEEQLTRLNTHKTRDPISSSKTDPEKNAAHVLDLESRLHNVEKVIGTDELSSKANLRMHLRDLDRKVNVLYSPDHEMEAIKQKVSELNMELESLAKSKRMAQLGLPEPTGSHALEPGPTTPVPNIFEKKVDSVISKLDDIELTKRRLPAVISRLRSLHETHCDLAGAVATIGEFDNTLGALERDLNTWNQSLETVKRAMGKHSEVFDEKSQHVERELQKMEARVDALVKKN